jgi:hypothetical protein
MLLLKSFIHFIYCSIIFSRVDFLLLLRELNILKLNGQELVVGGGLDTVIICTTCDVRACVCALTEEMRYY